jgi:hypothetical protein
MPHAHCHPPCHCLALQIHIGQDRRREEERVKALGIFRGRLGLAQLTEKFKRAVNEVSSKDLLGETPSSFLPNTGGLYSLSSQKEYWEGQRRSS